MKVFIISLFTQPRMSSGGGRGINPMLLIPLMRMLFSKTGLILAAIVVGVMWLSGTNPLTLLQQFTGGSPISQLTPYQATEAEEILATNVGVMLADTEDLWNKLLDGYREPTLVLFTGGLQSGSACGFASAPGISTKVIPLKLKHYKNKTSGKIIPTSNNVDPNRLQFLPKLYYR